MNKAVIKALQAEQNRLEKDLHKVRLALSAFKTSKQEQEEKPQSTAHHKTHVYRRRFKKTCERAGCGRTFACKNTKAKWCSPSCKNPPVVKPTAPAQSQINPPHGKSRPVTLLPGDPIRAGHN